MELNTPLDLGKHSHLEPLSSQKRPMSKMLHYSTNRKNSESATNTTLLSQKDMETHRATWPHPPRMLTEHGKPEGGPIYSRGNTTLSNPYPNFEFANTEIGLPFVESGVGRKGSFRVFTSPEIAQQDFTEAHRAMR